MVFIDTLHTVVSVSAVKMLLPGLLTALLMGTFFGINAIADGYGDSRLFASYLLTFIPAFLVLSLGLRIYGYLRRIHPTLFNGLFLLCAVLTSLEAFFIVFIALRPGDRGGFLSPRLALLLSFLIAFSIFIWASTRRARARKYFVVVSIACLVAPWLFVFATERLASGRKAYPPPSTPNILLLTIDALRYDFLGCYGNSEISTPHLDSLAKRGVVFDNHFVQAPYTTASLSSLMTGLYPFKHGARVFGQHPRPEYDSFLGDLVSKGYDVKASTWLLTSLLPKSGRFDFQRGPLTYRLIIGLSGLQYVINERLGNYLPALFGEYCFPSNTSMDMTLRVLQYIRHNRNRSWFFWAHFYKNVHSPYDAPPQFIEMYKSTDRPLKTFWSLREIKELNDDPRLLTDDVVEGIRVAYSAEVSCIDRQIGMIVRLLGNLNLMENTVIIISADHGELLGEHDYVGHGDFLVDLLIRVPLIVHYPGHFESGTRIRHLTEEVDIAPTILDICGIDGERECDGTSLLNLLDSDGWHKDAIYAEVVRYDGEAFLCCYRTEKHKLMYNSASGGLSLYDVTLDPDEETDVKDALSGIAASLKQQLLTFSGYHDLKDLTPSMEYEADEDMKRRLRAVGYFQ
jgi:arylsulfatase